jgi:serine/threonine protein kinase
MELFERLRRHELLNEKQIAELEACAADLDSPVKVADELVRRKWLTAYQAQFLIKDKLGRLELGAYRLLEPIGEGGMGEVFLARQKKLERYVAVKLIRAEFAAANSDALARFHREALLVAKLAHANIIHIYDADEVNGTHFLVMEYVRGMDLSRLVWDRGPLPVAAACDYIRQAALGLQHAFEAGLVHRDIKPSNLLVSLPENPSDGHGLVKILDLGLACLSEEPGDHVVTRLSNVLGTPDFISPEQARDPRQASIQSDLYSLGCTMYYILSGQVPFPDRTAVQKILCHQLERPKPILALRPDLRNDVQNVLNRLMKKEPRDRYQTPSDAAVALAAILRDMSRHGMGSKSSPRSAKQKSSGTPVAKAKPEVRLPSESPPPSLAGLQVTHLSMVNPLKSADVSWLSSPPKAAQPSLLAPPPTAKPPAPATAVGSARGQPAASVRVIKAATLTDIGALSTIQSANAPCTAILQGHVSPVVSMEFDPPGAFLATGGLDHAIRVWRVEGENARQESAFFDPRLGEIRAISFLPIHDEILIGASGLGGRVWRWRWRLGSSEEMNSLEHATGATVLAVSGDGKNVAAAEEDKVQLWAASGSGITARDLLKGRGCAITALAFSRFGDSLFAADSRGRVLTWRATRKSYRADSTFVAHSANVTSLAVSPDGRRLATAGADNSVRLWSATDEFAEVATISNGLRGVVRRLQFTADSCTLLTVSDAGQVAGWSSTNAEPLSDWRLHQPVCTSYAISSNGSAVAVGRTDNAVNLYQIPKTTPAAADALVVCSR